MKYGGPIKQRHDEGAEHHARVEEERERHERLAELQYDETANSESDEQRAAKAQRPFPENEAHPDHRGALCRPGDCDPRSGQPEGDGDRGERECERQRVRHWPRRAPSPGAQREHRIPDAQTDRKPRDRPSMTVHGWVHPGEQTESVQMKQGHFW